ncbi:hypothetical protein V7S79_05415 [Aquirufa sp. ROCK-SH2]
MELRIMSDCEMIEIVGGHKGKTYNIGYAIGQTMAFFAAATDIVSTAFGFKK